MSKLVELYLQELKKQPPTIRLEDVPVGLRKAVEAALKGSNIKEGDGK